MKTVNLRPHLKRNILIAAVLLLVCAAAFLNWSYKPALERRQQRHGPTRRTK